MKSKLKFEQLINVRKYIYGERCNSRSSFRDLITGKKCFKSLEMA
jgi:hypothetical protein